MLEQRGGKRGAAVHSCAFQWPTDEVFGVCGCAALWIGVRRALFPGRCANSWRRDEGLKVSGPWRENGQSLGKNTNNAPDTFISEPVLPPGRKGGMDFKS